MSYANAIELAKAWVEVLGMDYKILSGPFPGDIEGAVEVLNDHGEAFGASDVASQTLLGLARSVWNEAIDAEIAAGR